MSETVLFDLPSRAPNACWSLNPWKTRMLLNFKKIPYTTTWVEYPDLAPTFKGFGLEPNKEGGGGLYTSPVLLFDGKYTMDSAAIATVVDAKVPDPPIYLEHKYHVYIRENLGKIFGPLMPVWMPKVPKNLLNPPSVEYFERTRAERLGMSLDDFQKAKGGLTDGPWDAARADIEGLAATLKENPEGPFFMGATVSYADFMLVTAMQFFKRVDINDFERFMGYDKAFGELYDACKEWLEREDH